MPYLLRLSGHGLRRDRGDRFRCFVGALLWITGMRRWREPFPPPVRDHEGPNDKDMRNGIQGCQSLNLRVTMGTTWKPTSPLSIKITMTDLHHYTN
ncbi:unnamed protein product [Prunus armeniaca]|uniref:Uncharacterized protein n=1 Tax=Prunus armeniaca TaxID=36596 RepID=A0A6J5XVH9_PRUAR|nr:unnamed protein product [Prunus armeniaca]